MAAHMERSIEIRMLAETVASASLAECSNSSAAIEFIPCQPKSYELLFAQAAPSQDCGAPLCCSVGTFNDLLFFNYSYPATQKQKQKMDAWHQPRQARETR